jgi:hypothetical protein
MNRQTRTILLRVFIRRHLRAMMQTDQDQGLL